MSNFGKWLATPLPGEEVVITGVSGRLPESNNIYEFRDNLFNKKDMVTADGRRWVTDHREIPQRNAKIYNIDKLDCGYFGLHYRQADLMDPMMRKFLETTIEAIMDAGVNPAELAGSKTGVYVGACYADMEIETLNGITEPQKMGVTGYLRSFIPNRISYYLKLRGPSYIVDTACSSSLNALEQAFKAIRSGQCDNAIVGGVNLLIHPGITLQFYRLGVLSDDGTCKVFDQDADGYVRGETIACIFLQKAKIAKRIYAQVVYSKVNCDGFKPQGITFPSTQMQQELMTDIFEESGTHPSELSFLEAHGTGTEVGDPQEVDAIDRAIARKRSKPLLTGSVKCSVGHTEPASGLCSLIKVIIAMETGKIPPNIKLKKIKEGMEGFEAGRMKAVTEEQELEGDDCLIGINNFGFGGNNAHLLVRRFKKTKIHRGVPVDDIPRLVCISGRTEEAVLALLENVNNNKIDVEYIALLHQLFRSNIENHLYRGFTIISKDGPIKTSSKFSIGNTSLLYIFFGSLKDSYKNLGQHLVHFTVFQNTVSRINKYLLSKNFNTVDITFKEENQNGQNLLGALAVQIGIVDILKLLELYPKAVFADSVGKLVSAYYYQILTLEEAVLTAYKLAQQETELISEINFEDVFSQLKISDKRATRKQDRYFFNNTTNKLEAYGDFMNHEDLKQLSKNLTILNISDNPINDKDSLLVEDGNVKFLEILGNLYLQGHNPQIHKLYPEVKFPVSRSTPMISPLVKWNYDRSWYTYKFTCFVSSDAEQKEFNLSSALYEEHKYMSGHCIDGRILVPATEYLNLVWQTFAESRRLLAIDLAVIFENCKFIRAVTLPKAGAVKLLVSIQQGSGNFEILEKNSLVVSGRITRADNLDQHQIPLEPIPFDDKDPKMILEQDEIYRELYLRGYNYNGLFKGLVKSNVDSSAGLIKWENNWTTFIDKMLQIRILQMDTRSLYVPVGIKKLIIDPVKHFTSTENNEEALLPLYVYKEPNIIKSGGVELHGILANSIAKRKPQLTPVLEKYQFVPNMAVLDLAKSVRINIQIILENCLENNFKAIEILDDATRPASKHLLPLVCDVLDDVPLVNPDLTISTKLILDEIPGVKIEDLVLTSTSNLILIVGTKILNKSSLNAILGALSPNGFVLTREEIDFVPGNQEEIEIASEHITEDEKLILFRKSVKFSSTKCIKLSSDDFNWIPDLQASLKDDANVLVYSQNEQINGIIGFVNCIRREPGGSRVKCFFMVDEAPEFDPSIPFYQEQIKKNLGINIYKNSKWGTYRHLLLEDSKEVEREHCYVNSTVRGDLSSLKWIEGPLSSHTRLTKNQVMIHAYYAPINFKDIMLASGRINGDVFSSDRIEQECLIGFEFSGRDLSGKRVTGMINNGALSTLVVADKTFLWEIPDSWSMEDGSTIPVVYSTVIYSLFFITRIRAGFSILIHSATGGIGLAALNVCLYHGCNVFVTVGTQEKRDYLKKHYPQIPSSHIGNSRDTSFEEMIKTETRGRGVDAVLNSLTEEKLKASIRCLAKGGSFLEIGKFDLANDTSLNLMLLEKDASYHGIMLDRIFMQSPEIKEWLVQEIYDGMRLGFVKPLPLVVFGRDEIEKAFRYMTTGKHIGKVAIKIREEEQQMVVAPSKSLFKAAPRFNCDQDKSYVIIGGLGGFGLELADWLMLRGAKKIVLVSTSGIKTGYQTQRIRIWKSYGVDVYISKIDVTTLQGCYNLIREANHLGPIDAIFNLAVVLKDALFEDQSEEKFKISLAPKAQVTKYLDQVTRELCPELRYFVIFSSVSCGRGNVGQTNYGMANSVMERICEKRKVDGLPALAVQWGAIGDVGLVAKMQKENKELVIGGTLQQKVFSCLEVLDKFLKQEEPVVASMVVAEKHNRNYDSGSAVDSIAYVLGIKDLKTISLEATLPELGMDSMAGTEILQLLEKDFEIYLTAKDVRNLTFAKLIEIEAEKKNLNDVKATKIEEGAARILQYIPNGQSCKIPVIKLSSDVEDEDKAPNVFVLPGVEGVFTPMEPFIKNLKVVALGVQYSYYNPEDSIEETAETCLPHIIEELGEDKDFNIISHSFGAVVTLEIAAILESRGYTGKIVLIDGAPAYLAAAAKEYLKSETDEEFQTVLLLKILSIFLPIELILQNKEKFAKCRTYDERMAVAKSLIPDDLSTKNLLEEQAVVTLYKRFKSVINYKFRHSKLKSSVSLVKAKYPMIYDIGDDYKLDEICEHPVQVTILDGDHATVLNNQQLVEHVNRLFCGGTK